MRNASAVSPRGPPWAERGEDLLRSICEHGGLALECHETRHVVGWTDTGVILDVVGHC